MTFNVGLFIAFSLPFPPAVIPSVPTPIATLSCQDCQTTIHGVLHTSNDLLAVKHFVITGDSLALQKMGAGDPNGENAHLNLAAMSVKIETVIPEQVKFLISWEEGT